MGGGIKTFNKEHFINLFPDKAGIGNQVINTVGYVKNLQSAGLLQYAENYHFTKLCYFGANKI